MGSVTKFQLLLPQTTDSGMKATIEMIMEKEDMRAILSPAFLTERKEPYLSRRSEEIKKSITGLLTTIQS